MYSLAFLSAVRRASSSISRICFFANLFRRLVARLAVEVLLQLFLGVGGGEPAHPLEDGDDLLLLRLHALGGLIELDLPIDELLFRFLGAGLALFDVLFLSPQGFLFLGEALFEGDGFVLPLLDFRLETAAAGEEVFLGLDFGLFADDFGLFLGLFHQGGGIDGLCAARGQARHDEGHDGCSHGDENDDDEVQRPLPSSKGQVERPGQRGGA